MAFSVRRGLAARCPQGRKKSMRAIIILICVLISNPSLGSTVRHRNVPERFWGTWAPSEDLCRDNKFTVVVSGKEYVTEHTSCRVQWVIETAGRSGPIYSAHMRCSSVAAPEHIMELNQVFVLGDSSQFSVGSHFKELHIYHRCSSQ
jgi:hypothetical protein